MAVSLSMKAKAHCSHPEYFFAGYDLVEWQSKSMSYVEKCFGTAVPPNRKVNSVPSFSFFLINT